MSRGVEQPDLDWLDRDGAPAMDRERVLDQASVLDAVAALAGDPVPAPDLQLAR